MNKKHYILECCNINIIIVYFCLQALDSSGEFESGFLYGNNFWLGSRSQCFDIMNRTPFEFAKRHIFNNTRYRNPQNEFPPFQLNYFVAYLRHNSTLQYHVNIPNEVSSFFLRLSRKKGVHIWTHFICNYIKLYLKYVNFFI